MKAIIIDPDNKDISCIILPRKKGESYFVAIQKAIESSSLPRKLSLNFTSDALFTDIYGSSCFQESQAFKLEGISAPIFGKALIIRIDPHGIEQTPLTRIEDMWEKVTFYDEAESKALRIAINTKCKIPSQLCVN